eukprot:1011016-Prorocentrum_lima.AAC.1
MERDLVWKLEKEITAEALGIPTLWKYARRQEQNVAGKLDMHTDEAQAPIWARKGLRNQVTP